MAYDFLLLSLFWSWAMVLVLRTYLERYKKWFVALGIFPLFWEWIIGLIYLWYEIFTSIVVMFTFDLNVRCWHPFSLGMVKEILQLHNLVHVSVEQGYGLICRFSLCGNIVFFLKVLVLWEMYFSYHCMLLWHYDRGVSHILYVTCYRRTC